MRRLGVFGCRGGTRDAFRWGQAAGCAPLWPSRGIHDHVVGESARDEERKIYLGAAPASSVLLFYFLTLMTSFSATKPILSEPA
jgi:hypothetical protein